MLTHFLNKYCTNTAHLITERCHLDRNPTDRDDCRFVFRRSRIRSSARWTAILNNASRVQSLDTYPWREGWKSWLWRRVVWPVNFWRFGTTYCLYRRLYGYLFVTYRQSPTSLHGIGTHKTGLYGVALRIPQFIKLNSLPAHLQMDMLTSKFFQIHPTPSFFLSKAK